MGSPLTTGGQDRQDYSHGDAEIAEESLRQPMDTDSSIRSILFAEIHIEELLRAPRLPRAPGSFLAFLYTLRLRGSGFSVGGLS